MTSTTPTVPAPWSAAWQLCMVSSENRPQAEPLWQADARDAASIHTVPLATDSAAAVVSKATSIAHTAQPPRGSAAIACAPPHTQPPPSPHVTMHAAIVRHRP